MRFFLQFYHKGTGFSFGVMTFWSPIDSQQKCRPDFFSSPSADFESVDRFFFEWQKYFNEKKEERIFFSFKRKPVHRRTSRDPQLFFIDFLLFLSFSFPTGFYRVLSSVFILIWVGFTEFQRVSSGSYWITLDDIKLMTFLRALPSLWLRYRVLPSFYWILIAFTEFFILIWVGFYRVSKGFEWFLLDYIGFHQTNDVPLGLTVALIALPSFT